MNKGSFKSLFSFEFWQKFGKALMVVIAVMPAAGLMISIGKSIPMINPNLSPLVITGGILEQIGWGVIGNLHILFALAIGGSWAKERAGGAFAAGLSFILINRITGAVFGVTSAMLADKAATVHTIFGGSIKVADYFISVLEAPALNMGVFVGIISGFVGATAFNKYYNYRKLPEALSFFNGKRFVPFVVIVRSAVTALVLAALWPVVQSGINGFGVWIANSQSTAPVLAPFLFGTLERLLLPFGLHHMLTIPINYTQLGGSYQVLTGAATSSASSQVINIINLLGGRANIVDVDACMTRLRVTVKDAEKVGTEEQWKAEGAMGLVMKGQGVQAIYGPKADVLKSDIQDVLDSGEVIPETLPSQMTAVQKAEATFKGVTDEVHSVADGEVINIEDVKDPVFSQKMMGDGFAVEPENGHIVSPVAGKVTSVFPTKHALGLVTDNGLEVLVHIGLDTVSLEGKPFEVKVSEGQTVAAGDLLVEADLDAIREAGRETSTIVVFTNADAIKSVKVEHTGKLAANAPVATVEL